MPRVKGSYRRDEWYTSLKILCDGRKKSLDKRGLAKGVWKYASVYDVDRPGDGKNRGAESYGRETVFNSATFKCDYIPEYCPAMTFMDGKAYWGSISKNNLKEAKGTTPYGTKETRKSNHLIDAVTHTDHKIVPIVSTFY